MGYDHKARLARHDNRQAEREATPRQILKARQDDGPRVLVTKEEREGRQERPLVIVDNIEKTPKASQPAAPTSLITRLKTATQATKDANSALKSSTTISLRRVSPQAEASDHC